MSQEQDFKKLQQRTYQSYHQDGLIDMIIGWSMIGFGLNMAFDNSAFLFFAWLPIIFYVPFKNRITVPRIGYVKFTASNRIVIGAVLAGLLVLLLGLFVFFLAGPDLIPTQISVWLRQNYMLLLGSIAALCFVGAALLTSITRLYAYAIIIVAIFAGGTWLDINPPIFVIATGLLIEAVGIWLLVRFLRKYPLASEEGAHES
jgi:hypothetical protein